MVERGRHRKGRAFRRSEFVLPGMAGLADRCGRMKSVVLCPRNEFNPPTEVRHGGARLHGIFKLGRGKRITFIRPHFNWANTGIYDQWLTWNRKAGEECPDWGAFTKQVVERGERENIFFKLSDLSTAGCWKFLQRRKPELHSAETRRNETLKALSEGGSFRPI